MKKEVVKKFFQFLEKKEERENLEVKLILFPESLPEGLKVLYSLYLENTPIQSLPKGLKVGGDLRLTGTPIQSLPEGLRVIGSLWLNNTSIQFLPEGLEVDGSLRLENTPIQSLPEGLKVGGDLFMERTPLVKKLLKTGEDRTNLFQFSLEEILEVQAAIRKELRSKNSYVKGRVFFM